MEYILKVTYNLLSLSVQFTWNKIFLADGGNTFLMGTCERDMEISDYILDDAITY